MCYMESPLKTSVRNTARRISVHIQALFYARAMVFKYDNIYNNNIAADGQFQYTLTGSVGNFCWFNQWKMLPIMHGDGLCAFARPPEPQKLDRAI